MTWFSVLQVDNEKDKVESIADKANREERGKWGLESGFCRAERVTSHKSRMNFSQPISCNSRIQGLASKALQEYHPMLINRADPEMLPDSFQCPGLTEDHPESLSRTTTTTNKLSKTQNPQQQSPIT